MCARCVYVCASVCARCVRVCLSLCVPVEGVRCVSMGVCVCACVRVLRNIKSEKFVRLLHAFSHIIVTALRAAQLRL